MAKEYDIYIKRRVTECDLMVFSLPFRDGLTATNRMILESCVCAYQLYKSIAGQHNTDLVSHIDKMIKICCEQLNMSASVDVDASFQTHYTIYPTGGNIALSPNEVSTLSTMFETGVSAMQFGAAPLFAQVSKSFGDNSSVVDISSIDIDSQLQEMLKQSYLNLHGETVIGADSLDMGKTAHFAVESGIEPAAGLEDLCYLIANAGSTAMEIAALVLGTEIHFSFGRAYDSIAIGASARGLSFQKYEIISHTLGILASLAEGVTYAVMPEGSSVGIHPAASFIAKRHRLFSDMDADTIGVYDNMTLEDIYYVII